MRPQISIDLIDRNGAVLDHDHRALDLSFGTGQFINQRGHQSVLGPLNYGKTVIGDDTDTAGIEVSYPVGPGHAWRLLDRGAVGAYKDKLGSARDQDLGADTRIHHAGAVIEQDRPLRCRGHIEHLRHGGAELSTRYLFLKTVRKATGGDHHMVGVFGHNGFGICKSVVVETGPQPFGFGKAPVDDSHDVAP